MEGLRNLKSDLQKMIEMVPSIVEEHLNNDKYWAHRGQLSYEPYQLGPYRVQGNRVPDELSEGVRELLGYVGAILIKHGFADTKQYSEWETKHGFERPRYSYGYDCSDKMITVLKSISHHCTI